MAVNYDHLADRFDERYRHQTYPGIRTELRNLVDRPEITVLEVGCGTGHWLKFLSDLPVQLCGTDRSLAMLDRARAKAAAAALVCASAEYLPFSSGSVDVIFCVNSFHHFSDPEKFLRGGRLLLRNAGCLAIFGLDPHVPEIKWYLYEHFPGLREKDLQRYIPHVEIACLMSKAGFHNVFTKRAERIQKTYWGKEVFSDPFLERTSTSQLQILSEDNYKQGKSRMLHVIESREAAGERAAFMIDLPLLATVGYVR
jgi:SAM-dependent methyltransferase